MATSSGHVFATVGTTKFDLFVRTLTSDDVLRELYKKGFVSLTIQFGKGSFIPKDELRMGVQVHSYRYKDSIAKDISDADLVISHAGAGTCLEVLEHKKKLIVVVNEDLMDNHQIELAEQLHKNGHVLYCTPGNLFELINSMNLYDLQPLPPSSASNIAKFIDEFMGFRSTLNKS